MGVRTDKLIKDLLAIFCCFCLVPSFYEPPPTPPMDREQLARLLTVHDCFNSNRIGRLTDTKVELLVELFDHPDQDVRRSAVSALEGRSDLPPTAVAGLRAILRSNDEIDLACRFYAALVLAKQTTSTAADLAEMLKHDDEDVRSFAAMGCRSWNVPKETVVDLTAMLQDPSGKVRESAALALMRQVDMPETVILAVAALLQDTDAKVRRMVAEALAMSHYTSLPESVVANLMTQLDDEDKYARAAAAEALLHQKSGVSDTIRSQAMAQLERDDFTRSVVESHMKRYSE